MIRIFLLSVAAILIGVFSTPVSFAEPPEGAAGNLNRVVLSVIQTMPVGGRYAVTGVAHQSLAAAISHSAGHLSVDPQGATPSFCSSATYLVFLRSLQELMREGSLKLDSRVLEALLVRGQRDGEGAWGRWNANGPGTARFFFELGLGPNFTSYENARAGDFMKIFWTPEIGARERGHSVVYLGRETVAGVEQIRFWSSNQPLGYGIKSVPRSKIARAVFSRLEQPANLSRLQALPRTDAYLGSLLKVRSSAAELGEKCGISESPARIGPGPR
ncbi:MAG: hypothetical protein V4710_13460 [Verrucomicrobiota bacterium]